jgi:hypothetical protein
LARRFFSAPGSFFGGFPPFRSLDLAGNNLNGGKLNKSNQGYAGPALIRGEEG